MLFSWKFQFLFCFFISASSTSVQKVEPASLPNAIMIINKKMEDLRGRMDQLESNGNNAFDAHEIITNITRALISANDRNSQQLEEKLLNKIDKLEEKLNKMAAKVSELLSASEKREGVFSGVSEWCHSTCRDRVTTWANATDTQLTTSLEHLNRCLQHQQTTTEPPTTTSPIIVCHPNLCLHGGRCQPSSTGSGNICVCPKFISGNRCENVECTVEERCWRLNDTLYTVIETNLTWTEAKVKCESLNMTLAMPKDQERTQFLWDQLKPIYGTQHYLWLGLKRETSGWFWLDGSTVGDYTGGWTDMKNENRSFFGQLFLSGGSKMWTWGDTTERVHPVCETVFFPQ